MKKIDLLTLIIAAISFFADVTFITLYATNTIAAVECVLSLMLFIVLDLSLLTVRNYLDLKKLKG